MLGFDGLFSQNILNTPNGSVPLIENFYLLPSLERGEDMSPNEKRKNNLVNRSYRGFLLFI